MKKNPASRFGYGAPKYRRVSDFPASLEHDGCHWYRSSRYTFLTTGMTTYRYETDERKEDLRVFIDAAGCLWDEKTHGIL